MAHHVHHHHHTHQHHHVGLTHIGGVHETVVTRGRETVERPRPAPRPRADVPSINVRRRQRYSSLVHQIRKAPAAQALRALATQTTLPAYMLIPAARRCHKDLFLQVLGKVDGYDPRLVQVLTTVPSEFLYEALRGGLNINSWRHASGEDLATYLSRRYLTRHLRVVLEWSSLELSQAACDMVQSDPVQKELFQGLLFARGMVASKEHAIDALERNDTEALKHIIESLVASNKKWEAIEELLTCPITQEVTADLVQTPTRHLYDRSALENWIKKHENCPLTRNELYIDDLKGRDELLPDLLRKLQEV